ncbi:CASP-like protein 2B1 [Silene latifolia]|uniref:CASP-like protein 2B1 n=1 Tax=Silene latifolia TaxID=37657 RepID=UPI003D77735C
MTSPGNVAVYHGSCSSSNSRLVCESRLKIAELVLRILILGLGVLATALIVSNTQVQLIFSIKNKAKYIDMKSLLFLVLVNGIIAAYSLLHILRCLTGIATGTILFSKPIAWLIFSGDQVYIHTYTHQEFKIYN